MAEIILIPLQVIVERNEIFTGNKCDKEREKALKACYGSFYYYDTVQEQISSIILSLVKDHFFIDGNKRTALFTYILLAEINKLKYIKEIDEQVKIFVNLAASHNSVQETAKILFS